MNEFQLAFYNENKYIKCLSEVYSGLNSIEEFLLNIEINNSYRDIEKIISIYDKIFKYGEIAYHTEYKIGRVYKPLYLVNPGEFSKSNSYWHIRLKLKSPDIILFDDIYENKLSQLLKFLKHLFSKIDNYFASSKVAQLNKFKNLLDDIRADIKNYLSNVEHRNIISKR